MKKQIFSTLFIALLGISYGHAQAVQDFTHGIFVEKADFAKDPSKYLGKVVELKEIPYAPVKVITPNSKPKSGSPIQKTPVKQSGANTQAPSTTPNISANSTPASSPGAANNGGAMDCPAIKGFTAQIIRVTPTWGPCMSISNTVKNQFPKQACNIDMFVFCRPDGTYEIKRVRASK